MSGRLLLTIAVVIIAAHALVIYLFMRGGCSAAKPGQEAQAQQQRKVEAPPPEPPKPAHENSNFGKPFSYESAVKGDIPGLPDCKSATAGILVDLGTRQVLWAKNPRDGFPIASMTKMMTMLLAQEDVLEAKGGVTLDTQVKVTHAAMKIGGSQVYLDPRESFPLRELLKAVAIQSANDAAYLVAEFLGGGDVNSFVARMNAKAAELKMPGAKFFNPHGLPGKTAAEDNACSPEGMAILAEHILEHPQLMEWASKWLDSFREPGTKGYVQLRNHNRLIPGSSSQCPGVDGLKTGFINRSGFCVTITCKRGGRRLVAVVTGFPSSKSRDEFVRKLLDWGYARAAKPESVATTPGGAAKTAAAPQQAKTPASSSSKKAASSKKPSASR